MPAEGKVLDGFQQLMEVQNEQFRQMSDSLGRFFAAGTGKEKKAGAESGDG